MNHAQFEACLHRPVPGLPFAMLVASTLLAGPASGEVLFTQGPPLETGALSGLSVAAFSNGGGQELADQFTPATDFIITEATWYGIFQTMPVPLPATVQFDIAFWDDSAGVPAAVPQQTQTLAAAVSPTGLTIADGTFAGFEILEFSSTLDSPVLVPAGETTWVSIVDTDLASAQWLWSVAASDPSDTSARRSSNPSLPSDWEATPYFIGNFALTLEGSRTIELRKVLFEGVLDAVLTDRGGMSYSGIEVGTPFSGFFDLVTGASEFTLGTTTTEFNAFFENGSFFEFADDLVLSADDAAYVNLLPGNSFAGGEAVDYVAVFGDVPNALGGRFEAGLQYVLDPLAFGAMGPETIPPLAGSISSQFVSFSESDLHGIVISLDTFANGGGDEVAIDLIVDGEVVARNLTNPYTNGSFVPVSVDFFADGTLSMTYGGAPIFTNVPTGFAPRSRHRFGFGARTGAGNEEHRVDNVNITACRVGSACSTPDGQYVNDFTLGAGAAVLLGDAVIEGGNVRLTDNVNVQLGSLVVDDIVPGGTVASFSASFDVQLGPGTLPPADGMSFLFGPSFGSEDDPFGEEGVFEDFAYEAVGRATEIRFVGHFDDVSSDFWAFDFVERLVNAGITSGCGNGLYCPDGLVTRAQMAVFLERGMRGSDYSPPPATGTVFLDVPYVAFAASWIEQLFADGITSGCGGGNYCPSNSVTRAQMAVFLLRAIHGSDFAPPPPSGVFGDVAPGDFAAAWIEQLAAEGITGGCGGGNFCPGDPVTRAQMAVFLVRAFGL